MLRLCWVVFNFVVAMLKAVACRETNVQVRIRSADVNRLPVHVIQRRFHVAGRAATIFAGGGKD